MRAPVFDIPDVEAPSIVDHAPVECQTLAANGLGHHDVLRVFDDLRRRLTLRLRGTEGCFAGHSRLELCPIPDEAHNRVAFIAVVVNATAESLDLQFEAFLEPDTSPLGEPSTRSARIALGAGSVVAFQ